MSIKNIVKLLMVLSHKELIIEIGGFKICVLYFYIADSIINYAYFITIMIA